MTGWTDAFIGVADSHARYLIEKEHFPTYKVRVVPNGVDASRFHSSRDSASLRQALGLSVTTPVAGIVAALRPEKNHEMFLQVAALVRKDVPDAQFLVIGDGPERAKLERIAAELNLESTVRFLGTRNDIPELLAALDVFLLTSRIEANPVSILEAMATGKPVVAPRVGSISESVNDGETGFLIEPNDTQQAAAAVVRLLLRPELAQRLGQAGRAAVVERWSLERMVEGYEDLITEVYREKSKDQRAQLTSIAPTTGQPVRIVERRS